jgi:hypothetical protein
MDPKELIKQMLGHRVSLSFHSQQDPEVRYTCCVKHHYGLSHFFTALSMDSLVDMVYEHLLEVFAHEEKVIRNG